MGFQNSASAEPGIRPDADQARVPGGGLDARYEQLRHAALHERASAFPLGLDVLTGKGITAWRRALTHLAPAAGPGSTQIPPGATAATLWGSITRSGLAGGVFRAGIIPE